MKKLVLFSFALFSLCARQANAQCIKDIQNLLSMPTPCFFVGMIDYDNPDCFDPELSAQYKYTWIIRSADDGRFVAMYDGMGFQHSFEKFGGYEFCLEIDKDGNPFNGADLVDCVTYTTCQICTGDKIHIEYLNCPFGFGCDIRLTTKIDAMNAVGLEPTAKYVITYLPTPQELAGGTESYDLEFDEIDVEHNAANDTIMVTQVLSVPYKRGCFVPRVIFSLIDGYGAHDMGWIACTEIALHSEEKFRCIACGNEDSECTASEVAAEISNTEGTCDLFTGCNEFREGDNSEDNGEVETGFTVSPNPATDRINIELPRYECEARQLMLFNNIGQPAMKINLPANETQTELYVDHLIGGLYLVAVIENGEIAYTNQVVISKL